MSNNNIVSISDTNNNSVSPLQEESLIILRRLVKTLSSLGVKDSYGRQRIVCDGMTQLLSGPDSPLPSQPTWPIGQLVTDTNGPSVNNTTQPSPQVWTGGNGTYYQNVWEGPVDIRWRYINSARITYSNAIRNYLN